MDTARIISRIGACLRPHGLRAGRIGAPISMRGMALAAAEDPVSEKPSQKYCQVSVKDGVAIIKLDQPNSKVNTLNKQLQTEFEEIYDSLVKDPAVKAAVVISGKPAAFIAGADIEMLQKAKTAEEATLMSKNGQKLFDKVANGKLPMVAAIHGEALGGGLEWALACHYRLATNSPKTKLGVPEVMIGLLPGAGGTQRLPQLVPLPDALDMMLTGKHISAAKAKKLGLVDSVIPTIGPGLKSGEENTQIFLEESAIQVAKNLASGKLKTTHTKRLTSIRGLTDYVTKNVGYVRRYIVKQAQATVLKKTKGKYPAPLKIIDTVETGLAHGMEAGLDREARAFGELAQSKEAKNLMAIFFAQRACKKPPKEFTLLDHPVKNICVLGAGLMGSGIASVSLGKFNVTIKDSVAEGLAKGQEHIWKQLNSKVKRKAMTTFERDTVFTALHADLTYKHFKDADLVQEAVPEKLELKHAVIKELEAVIPSTCIVATNTSALPIADVAKGSSRPENVVGMHYFSPVERMPLLEVIPHAGTANQVTAKAFDTGIRQGKTCIVVKDVPGFYVNRCLGPYNAEAGALLCQGVSVEAIDKAITSFGFPVGMMALGDEVGLDVAAHVQMFLAKHLGDRMKGSDPAMFLEMTKAGFLGRKSGKGFYVYGGKKKVVNEEAKPLLVKYRSSIDSTKLSMEEIQMRVVCRLVNEAAICLQDDIIRTPVEGDIGMVFGIGFPAFLGGPFRFMDSIGAQSLVDRMLRYRDVQGPQYTPAPLLVDMAKNNTAFYK